MKRSSRTPGPARAACLAVSSVLWLAVLLLGATLPGQNGDGLVWSTYLGGNGADTSFWRRAVLVAGNGDVIVWGTTDSPNFPTWGAYQSSFKGGLADAFITRFAADGKTIVWSTFLGGSGQDRVRHVSVDAGGVVTVFGHTTSPDFPTTPGAYQTKPQGLWDAFVARFVWNGGTLQLLWSTRLGAQQDDFAGRMAILPTGSILVAGSTGSPKFPIVGPAFQRTLAGNWDGFLAVLDSTGGQLLASTFVGGSGRDAIEDLVLDAAGNPVAVGHTESANFPVTPNALQTGYGGNRDGFVTSLDLGLRRSSHSTYFGGSGRDEIYGVAATGTGQLAIGGITASANLRTTQGAFDRTLDGAFDAFAALLDTRAAGPAQLRWSTYLGGRAMDHANSLTVDRHGKVTVAGAIQLAASPYDFPTTPGAHDTSLGGSVDGFVTCFDPARRGRAQLVYSTYLGGSASDGVYSVDVDGRGNVVVVGETHSTDFPTTTGAYQTRNAGGKDAFVTKLSLLPRPMFRYGASTPACLWPIHQGVYGPVTAGKTFEVYAGGAPPSAMGALLFGRTNPPGFPLLNLQVYLGAPVLLVPCKAGPDGRAILSFPIPNVPLVGPVASQWLFETSAACPGSGLLASSEGLRVF